MQKVERWQTSDGELFVDESKAKEHQAVIDFRVKLEAIVSNFYYRGIEQDEIVEGIVDNFTELKELFKSARK